MIVVGAIFIAYLATAVLLIFLLRLLTTHDDLKGI